MASLTKPSIDFARLQEQLASQFRYLDPKDPSNWPSLPRFSLFAATAIAIVVVLWFAWLSGSQDVLQGEQDKEIKLREDYKTKLSKAVNLDVLKKQREQVQQRGNPSIHSQSSMAGLRASHCGAAHRFQLLKF